LLGEPLPFVVFAKRGPDDTWTIEARVSQLALAGAALCIMAPHVSQLRLTFRRVVLYEESGPNVAALSMLDLAKLLQGRLPS
jgi:hypothetical protein